VQLTMNAHKKSRIILATRFLNIVSTSAISAIYWYPVPALPFIICGLFAARAAIFVVIGMAKRATRSQSRKVRKRFVKGSAFKALRK